MNSKETSSSKPTLAQLPGLPPELEALYTDVHAHPELSMEETRTAGLAADRLRAAGYDVTTAIGKTGVVGLWRNGEGPTVMLRANMDALPVEEETGLPYASKVRATDRDGNTVPVTHACGHDMHVAWLVGATTLLAQARGAWRGTLMAVFQPAEETAEGAQAMIDDGSSSASQIRGGTRPARDGRTGRDHRGARRGHHLRDRQSANRLVRARRARLDAAGQHRSRGDGGGDGHAPADHRRRELAAAEAAVVTIGSLQAGTKENVIPDEAVIKLNVRSFDDGVRRRVLAAIERIVKAEAAASGAPRPPEITPLDRYPLAVNDPAASRRVADAFSRYFSADRVREAGACAGERGFFSARTSTRTGARACEAAARVEMRAHVNSDEPPPHFGQIRTRTSCGQFACLSCVCGHAACE